MTREEFAALQAAAATVLAAKYGPRWPRLGEKRGSRVGEVIALAQERGLELDLGFTPRDLAPGSQNLKALTALRLLKPVANEVYKANRDADQEVTIGAYAEAGFATDVPLELQSRGKSDRLFATHCQRLFGDELAALERAGPDKKALASLIAMHLGKAVVPGQPARLLGAKPCRDLIGKNKNHPVGPGGRCPTCAAIARFVRIQGLGPTETAALVDAFFVEQERKRL